jgi:hypothetical protein
MTRERVKLASALTVALLVTERGSVAAELPGLLEQFQRAIALTTPFEEFTIAGIGVAARLSRIGAIEQLGRFLEVFLSRCEVFLRLIDVRLHQQRFGMFDGVVQFT